MENIDIAELLKDCPSGMELDCILFEGLEFDSIVDNAFLPIRCRIKNSGGGYNVYNFTKYGCWIDMPFAKCIIFPKDKTTWEGFQRPFKDGDIAISESGDIHLLKTSSSSYCAYRDSWEILPKFDSTITTNVTIVRLATEEEKEKLFDAIKEHGYKWNEETKTLEKLPKFKVGNRVKSKINQYEYKIIDIRKDVYIMNYANDKFAYHVPFCDEDNFSLVPNKFDITTLIPYESRVLVRNDREQYWIPAFWGCKRADGYTTTFGWCKYCIPFEGNEHLLETNNDCNEYYKTWK